MIAIASVIIVVLLSLIVTRVATVILTLTGLSRESARFQARSAFSGVGFTTSEAESIVNHPVRRRVVMTLMLVGSAGIVAVVIIERRAPRRPSATRAPAVAWDDGGVVGGRRMIDRRKAAIGYAIYRLGRLFVARLIRRRAGSAARRTLLPAALAVAAGASAGFLAARRGRAASAG